MTSRACSADSNCFWSRCPGDQLFAFGQQSPQFIARLQAGIQCELAAAQALQVFKRALLLTVISEQAAQGLDLLKDRLRLCFGLLEQYFQGVAQLVQFPGSQFGPAVRGRVAPCVRC